MSAPSSRRKKRTKISLESNDQHTSEVNSVNTYGVRYGPNLTGNASRHRFSRSTNHVMSSNATANLTRRGFDLRRSSGLIEEDEGLQDLLKQKWHIYCSSAIHCFDPTTERLAQCSKFLSDIMYAKSNHSQNNVTYSSKFHYSHGCPATLSVELYSNTKRKLRSNSILSKLIYEGHFLSWDEKRVGVADENLNPENSTALSMPLLLCKSSIGTAFMKNVHSCLMTIFDIVISGISLSQEDMAWLMCLASSDILELQTNKSAIQEVHFFYDVPDTSLKKCEPHICVSYELDLVLEIWKCVHQRDGVEDEVLYEEVLSFLRSFEEHSLCSYGVNLSECSLVKVVMPNASFAVEGMIKVSSMVVAGRILRFLADVCSTGDSIVPSLGFSVSLSKC